MKKQIVILFTLLLASITMSAQVTFQNKIVTIQTPAIPGTLDHQIHIQNLDAIWESITYWSDSGVGDFVSPYCNIRVSRTSFDSTLLATSEWHEDFNQETVSITVAAMPNRKVLVDVKGGDFEIQTTHVAYGGKYTMYDGNTQFWPTASLSEGSHTLFIPYRIKGQQGARIKVKRTTGCDVEAGRIFYLN